MKSQSHLQPCRRRPNSRSATISGVWICFAMFIVPHAVTARESSKSIAPRPNVVLIMTDDQGYGDLASHGNPRIKTPNLDRIGAEGIEVSNFHVCPVCSPTRSSLLTGRYHLRTGICDTFLGRSMMFSDETTLAEHLSAAGYATGIFGKWHLGDCYPMRAIDQGFAEALVIRGGGLRQNSDPPESTGYFNPTVFHNGKPEKATGYCSDVFTNAAIEYIERNRERPFFVYLPFNCPHSPLDIAESEVEPYRKPPMKAADFPHEGQPIGPGFNAEATAKLYGMVANIDANIGRLLSALDRLKLTDNTIVIFLTDNGPQQPRYNAGLRGLKGTVWDGGIRVPFFIRWPGRLPKHVKVDLVAAHIDVTPTLLAACGVEPLAGSKPMDGVNILPALEGKGKPTADRTLFFQWHRGNIPERQRACAVRTERWKLVQPKGQNGADLVGEQPFELYDLQTDPYETKNIAAANPEIVDSLTQRYDAWYEQMKAERGFQLPLIKIGTDHEPTTVLTPQDWRGPDEQRVGVKIGKWFVDAAPGEYRLKPMFKLGKAVGKVQVNIGGKTIVADAAMHDGVAWESKGGPTNFEASAEVDGKTVGADYLVVTRAGASKP